MRRVETRAIGIAKIDEEREALRLNPKNAVAHMDLGVALGHKGDGDGELRNTAKPYG